MIMRLENSAYRNHLSVRTRRQDEDFDEEEEAAYKAAAEDVALRVQRQQNGLENSSLSEKHFDKNFRLVDDIEGFIARQRDVIRKVRLSRSSFLSLRSSQTKLCPMECASIADWYTEYSKYVPLRLEYEERTHLRRVQAIMKACDYTNLIDGIEHKTKQIRIHRQGAAVRAVLLGIAASFDYDIARECCTDFNFKRYEKQFQKIFEIARRYKIMNPEKMRGVYGKMIYLLQDAMAHKSELEFDLVCPLKTVHSTLAEGNCLQLLRDELLSTAVMEILPEGRSRGQIQDEIKLKERAINTLAQIYSTKDGKGLSADTIKRCLYSLADNTSFLDSNCKPIDYAIDCLREFFGPIEVSKSRWSLDIYGGKDGSRLTHTHERQFNYVLQSLTLWREIVHDMFRLWYLAENDLLSQNEPYRLKNTGQGFNRLQQAPLTRQAIYGILFAVQQRLGKVDGWVGSSVIHLGDHNVPNALLFIDKYLSIPRILNPIVHCIKYIQHELVKDKALVKLIEAKFGSKDDAIRTILHDFFRFAFDGSGADNFFDAGSCIDGRLTSAWNWCQRLSEKEYYFIFKLSGFLSFDGEF